MISLASIKPATLRLAAWVALAVAIIGLVIVVAVYFATHGRLTINPPDGINVSSMSYCSGNCNNETEVSTSSSIIPSGKYVVQVNLSNSTSYIANVEVAGFFKTTTVTAKSKKYSPSVIVSPANQYVMPVANTFLTYDPDGSAYATDPSLNITAGKLAAAQYVSQHELLMVEYIGQAQDGVSQQQRVLKYNDSTNSITQIGTVSGISAANILHGNNSLYAVRTDTEGYTIVTMSAAGVKETKVPNSISFASNDSTPILAVSDGRIAVVSGNNYFIPQADESGSPGTNQSIVTVYDSAFQKIREISLGVRSDISSVSLSPDGKSIVVVGENVMSAYNTETGSLLFQTKAQDPNGHPLLWQDNDSFIYQLGTGGVYSSNLRNKESYSIVDNSLLRITDLSAVVSNKIYLTAFPNKSDNYDHTSPDGYAIDLGHDASSLPGIASDSIIRSLPYDGMTYSIGYHFDENAKVVIDVTAESGSRNSAVAKISELGFDPGDYTILFKNYTSPFVSEGGSNQ